jgi:hypothetical protein
MVALPIATYRAVAGTAQQSAGVAFEQEPKLVLGQEIGQRLIDLVRHSYTSLGTAYGLAARVIEY